jgi:hypothetical protein
MLRMFGDCGLLSLVTDATNNNNEGNKNMNANIKMTSLVSKAAMITAFAAGTPFAPLNLRVIQNIEREDGSNTRYNVTGYNFQGESVTHFVNTSKCIIWGANC